MKLGRYTPRFLLVLDVPRYGSRDEVVGFTSHVVDGAETEAYLDRVAAPRLERQYEGADYDLRVVDTAPRSSLVEHAHAEALQEDFTRHWLASGGTLDDVLPF